MKEYSMGVGIEELVSRNFLRSKPLHETECILLVLSVAEASEAVSGNPIR